MNSQSQRQKKLKQALRNREQLFAAWVSYANPSITETFAKAGFDFISIDMEHSTINLGEGQRIIAACHSENVPCLPRPVSHSNDYIKPLLESGADGILIQMESILDGKPYQLIFYQTHHILQETILMKIFCCFGKMDKMVGKH